jgi:UDP-glucuronate 4-epimerase
MSNTFSPFLITGAAGFIGSALVKALLKNGENVIGIDNINDYYDPKLKEARLKEIKKYSQSYSCKWHFYKISIENKADLLKISEKYNFKTIVNLAAQAGVRNSIDNPSQYTSSNLVGFFNILELCRLLKVKNFIFASSSSVYGGNENYPFEEQNTADHPLSYYGATKKANEIMAHSYSHLYDIPSTGLRFFTVYGPWGRPDMAPMLFAESMQKKKPIKVFNYGDMYRDFTYIDDVVEGIKSCCYKPAFPNNDFDSSSPEPSSSLAPFRIFNIGNSNPIKLLNFIETLENALGVVSLKEYIPHQLGDVKFTHSNSNKLYEWTGYRPNTSLEEGINKFALWYKNFYME